MRIAIIDDEEDARYLVRKALEKTYHEHISLIVEVDGVTAAQKLLTRENIDLIFLDIQMNDGTGFDLLEQLPDLEAQIVFVTAYDEFALRAFDFYAFAYLVKPFKQKTLEDVMDRLIHGHQEAAATDLRLLTDAYQNGHLQKIVVSELEGFHVVPITNILYLKSDNNYTEFFLRDSTHLTSSKTLKEYERLLEAEGFFRSHRSYLINLAQVRGYTRTDGGSVIMQDGASIPIGRRKQAEFRKKFLG